MKDTHILIRVSAQEKAQWDALAKQRGMSRSELIRFLLNAECRNSENRDSKKMS